MEFLFIYLIKSTLSLTLLYLSYELFFRKEAYYQFSRYLLLSTIFLALFLPLLPYNANQILSAASQKLNEVMLYSHLGVYTFDEVIISANAPHSVNAKGISLGTVLLSFYFLGFIFKSAQFLLRIYNLSLQIKYSKTINSEGLKFVYTSKGSPTYSFLNWLFVDPELLKNDTEFASILAHEKVHAEQGHSYDLIIAEILTIIQWFNPFVYLLKNYIKENHEYITDHEIITHFQDSHSYQLMLIKHSSIIKTNILTHNFSYSLLKRRLNIMKKRKNSIGFSVRLLVLASTLVLIFFACSSPQEKTPENDIPETIIVDGNSTFKVIKNKVSDNDNQKTTTVPDDQAFLVVEKMPKFVGGEKAMYEYIGSNLKYPEAAKKEGIQGRVFLSFIIEKDGQTSNVEILRGIGGGCDEAAIELIKNMPKWTPGEQRGQAVRVQYRMPIKFTLQ